MKITKVKQISKKKSITEKGITLIALVVTIIILLILAGVTLNLVLSNNGLIGRAKKGATVYEESEVRDEMSMTLASYELEKEITKIKFENFMTENGASNIAENGEEYEIEYKGYIFTVDSNNLEIKKVEKLAPCAWLIFAGVVTTNNGTVTEKQEEGTELKIKVKAESDKGVKIKKVEDQGGNTLTENNGIYTSTYTITKNGTYEFKITYTVEGKSVTKEIGIKVANAYNSVYIGKYVNYEPDKATYSKDLLKKSATGAFGSVSNENDFKTENYKSGWRILDYDEETGEMTIIMAHATTEQLGLGLDTGYNLGVNLINDMCEILFSKKTEGWNVTARGITIEDIEERLNEEGINARNTKIGNPNDTLYGNMKTYIDWIRYPKLYAEEIGAGVDKEETNVNCGSSYLKVSDRNKENIIGMDKAGKKLTVTQTGYALDLSSSYFKYKEHEQILVDYSHPYWLASRSVCCGGSWAGFCMSCMSHYGITHPELINSQGSGAAVGFGLRAIVHIEKGVKLVGTESGEDEENAITISIN